MGRMSRLLDLLVAGLILKVTKKLRENFNKESIYESEELIS